MPRQWTGPEPPGGRSLPRPKLAAFTSERRYFGRSSPAGELRLELMPAVAPMHVTSTIYLTLLGFYDTLTFHRIVKGFMAQGGDPLGDGRGSPGTRSPPRSTPPSCTTVAACSAWPTPGPAPRAANSSSPSLLSPPSTGKYSIFGKLVSGLDTLTAIEAPARSVKRKPALVTITSARISVE